MGKTLHKRLRKVRDDIWCFSPCLFYTAAIGVQVWVHGDDKVLLGTRKQVLALEAALGIEMLLKRIALLGFAEGDDKTARLLNRLLEFDVVDGVPVLNFEPGPRHVQIGLADLGWFDWLCLLWFGWL